MTRPRGRDTDEPGGAPAQRQLTLEAMFVETRVTHVLREDRPPPPVLQPVPPPRVAPETVAPPLPPPAPVARVFNVTELVRAARLALEARFADVRVEGEIAGLRRSPQGHIYFCLKDGEAQVDCVMFGREAGRLKFRPADGLVVRCRGRLTIYEGRGKFQLYASELEPAGAGALALAFEQLKQRLAAEGLFAPERKRKLPFLPRRLGVVTSQSGAVLRDIIRVAHRRYPMRILLSPTTVQGEGAPPQIILALDRLARVPEVDVIILARGGGSLQDLWAFNDEALARAIARCPVPVISAVGHETDFTIADFVADLRAPTPSAAAELAVPLALQLREDVDGLRRRINRAVAAELRSCQLTLERLRGRLGDPRRLVQPRQQQVDDLGARAATLLRARLAAQRGLLRSLETRLLRAHPQRRIADQRAAHHALEGRLRRAAAVATRPARGELERCATRLTTAVRADVTQRRRALDHLVATLRALSPTQVLERGYSIARTADGHVITDSAQPGVAVGQPVLVTLKSGTLTTRIESTGRAQVGSAAVATSDPPAKDKGP